MRKKQAKKVDLTPGAGLQEAPADAQEVRLPEPSKSGLLKKPSIGQVPCDLCQKPTRLFGKDGQIRAACDACKRVIMIGRIPNQLPASAPRALRKETQVDYSATEIDRDEYQAVHSMPGYEEG